MNQMERIAKLVDTKPEKNQINQSPGSRTHTAAFGHQDPNRNLTSHHGGGRQRQVGSTKPAARTGRRGNTVQTGPRKAIKNPKVGRKRRRLWRCGTYRHWAVIAGGDGDSNLHAGEFKISPTTTAALLVRGFLCNTAQFVGRLTRNNACGLWKKAGVFQCFTSRTQNRGFSRRKYFF